MRFTPPHFAEPIRSLRDVNENEWVLWSRTPDSIPDRGVSLTPSAGKSADDSLDLFIRHVNTQLYGKLSPRRRDLMLALLVDRDPSMLTIFRNFKSNDEVLLHQFSQYVQRRKLKQDPLLQLYEDESDPK
eukprot:TRINITY_DN4508_c0_g1_i3.p1 TRINITY_DN4508_c0_g1~~TRINITY_DN4508_c0_g1_i3.p1  ORF type:complete len:130 (-),score=10.54 TRINITY_DN4508_c0_g1_i3:113-502(-)